MKGPLEEAGRWLLQVQDEYQDAEDFRHRGRFYLALFLFQQAAEKARRPLGPPDGPGPS